LSRPAELPCQPRNGDGMNDEPKRRPRGLGYCAGFSGLEGYSAGYTSPIFPQSTGTLPCLGNGIASGRMFAIPQHPERHGMAQARNADRQRSWRTIRPKWHVWRGHDLYQLARTPSIACQTPTFVQDTTPTTVRATRRPRMTA
jgi:hypothetical protein